MNKNRLILFMLIMTFVVLPLFVSCLNTVSNDKGQLEIIENPIIEEVENADGIRVITVTKAKYIAYKMEPLWNTPAGQAPYGSTIGNEPKKEDGSVLSGYTDYKLIDANASNLGYFSQGKWALTLDVLDEEYKSLLSGKISKEVYLNTFSNRVVIDLNNEMFSSTGNFTLKIENLKLSLVENEDLYGKAEKNGYRVLVSVKTLASSGSNESTDIVDFVIPKDSISFKDVSGANTGTAVEGVINHTFTQSLNSGAYSITIRLQEHNGSVFVEAGGTTFSFIGCGGTEKIINGTGEALNLKAADYIEIGSDGIIIDSGIPSSVNVKAYKGVVSDDTLVSSTVNVTTNDTVTLVPEVTNGPSSISTCKWFVDGVEQTGTAIDSNGYLTLKLTTAKTYTITYMFLDGTNYNTISGNYYLTVTAAT